MSRNRPEMFLKDLVFPDPKYSACWDCMHQAGIPLYKPDVPEGWKHWYYTSIVKPPCDWCALLEEHPPVRFPNIKGLDKQQGDNNA